MSFSQQHGPSTVVGHILCLALFIYCYLRSLCYFYRDPLCRLSYMLNKFRKQWMQDSWLLCFFFVKKQNQEKGDMCFIQISVAFRELATRYKEHLRRVTRLQKNADIDLNHYKHFDRLEQLREMVRLRISLSASSNSSQSSG